MTYRTEREIFKATISNLVVEMIAWKKKILPFFAECWFQFGNFSWIKWCFLEPLINEKFGIANQLWRNCNEKLSISNALKIKFQLKWHSRVLHFDFSYVNHLAFGWRTYTTLIRCVFAWQTIPLSIESVWLFCSFVRHSALFISALLSASLTNTCTRRRKTHAVAWRYSHTAKQIHTHIRYKRAYF